MRCQEVQAVPCLGGMGTACGTVTGAAFGMGKVTQCDFWSRIIVQKMEIYSNRSQVADRWEPRVNLTELNGRDEGA